MATVYDHETARAVESGLHAHLHLAGRWHRKAQISSTSTVQWAAPELPNNIHIISQYPSEHLGIFCARFKERSHDIQELK